MDISKISTKLVEDSLISEDEKEIIEYGIISAISQMSVFCFIAFIGFCFGSVWSGIFLWICTNFLRRNAGGYHAKTRKGCAVISVLIVIMVYCVFFLQNYEWYEYLAVLVITDIIIIVLSPLETVNKKLEHVEVTMYRKRTRWILMIENMIFFVGILFNKIVVVKIISMTVTIVSIALVWGKWVLVPKERRSRMF